MKEVVLITGSARPNSVNKIMTEKTQQLLDGHEGIVTKIADISKLNLPFFDAPMPPSMDGFTIEHDSVKQWSELIKKADGVIFIMPEYNHTLSAIQKNAIDWLYTEWQSKPSAIVTYGFYGGKHSLATFDAINHNIKLDLAEPIAAFKFGDAVAPGGSFINELEVDTKITATIDALLTKLKDS